MTDGHQDVKLGCYFQNNLSMLIRNLSSWKFTNCYAILSGFPYTSRHDAQTDTRERITWALPNYMDKYSSRN